MLHLLKRRVGYQIFKIIVSKYTSRDSITVHIFPNTTPIHSTVNGPGLDEMGSTWSIVIRLGGLFIDWIESMHGGHCRVTY